MISSSRFPLGLSLSWVSTARAPKFWFASLLQILKAPSELHQVPSPDPHPRQKTRNPDRHVDRPDAEDEVVRVEEDQDHPRAAEDEACAVDQGCRRTGVLSLLVEHQERAGRAHRAPHQGCREEGEGKDEGTGVSRWRS